MNKIKNNILLAFFRIDIDLSKLLEILRQDPVEMFNFLMRCVLNTPYFTYNIIN